VPNSLKLADRLAELPPSADVFGGEREHFFGGSCDRNRSDGGRAGGELGSRTRDRASGTGGNE
jgi:hypothetical protein